MDNKASEDQTRLRAWADSASVDALVALYARGPSMNSSWLDTEQDVEETRLGHPSVGRLSRRPSFESSRDLMDDDAPFGNNGASTSWLANGSTTSIPDVPVVPDIPKLPVRQVVGGPMTPLGRPVSLPRAMSTASSLYESSSTTDEQPSVPSMATTAAPLGRPVSINRLGAYFDDDLPVPELPQATIPVAWATPLGRPISLPRARSRSASVATSLEDGSTTQAVSTTPPQVAAVTPLGRPISLPRVRSRPESVVTPSEDDSTTRGPPIHSTPAMVTPLGRPVSLPRARSRPGSDAPILGDNLTAQAISVPPASAVVTPLGRPVSINRIGNSDYAASTERDSTTSLPPKYSARPIQASPLGRSPLSSSDDLGVAPFTLQPPPSFKKSGSRESGLSNEFQVRENGLNHIPGLARPPPIASAGRRSVSSTLSKDFSPGAVGASKQMLSPILSVGEKSPISQVPESGAKKIDEKSEWPTPTPAKPAAAEPAAAVAAAAPDKKKPQAKSSRWRDYIKQFKTFIRIFSYSTKRDRIFIFASIIGAICAGLTFPAMTIVFGNLVANVTTVNPQDRGESVQQMMTKVIDQSVLYMVYLFIARFTLGYIATLGFNHMSLRVSSALRLAYLKALLGQRVSLLDTQPPGQIAAIITSTANTLQSGISEQLGMIIQSLALIIAALGNAFYHSWELTLVTSSGLVLISICYFSTTPFVVKNMKEVEEMNIKASAVASEALSSVRMVAACGAEAKMVRRYATLVAESRKRGMAMSSVIGLQKATIFFSVMGTFALTFWFAVQMIIKGQIDNVSTLIVVLMCVMMSTNTIGTLAAPLSAAGRASSAAAILFNGIDAPKPKVTGLKAPEVSATERIVLWNVNFTYPTRPKQKVLDNLKLVIPAGKVTAIVGPSGSGKSTIVNLIERWYDLDGDKDKNKIIAFFRNGSIKIGGKNLHELDLKWWRSQIGLVQQEPFLFNDTIFKNVAHGLVGTEWEDAPEEKKRELVEQACKEAYADEFISRLPDGYDTDVGDQGSKLSGGQRQRLAIARSIVKQPKILILDEATSAIDVRGEKVVQAALDKVSKNRTTIMIAHRLSTVKKADNIVVLAKGQVVQWGTHEQLMAKVGGPYWVLTNSQQLAMGDKEDENPDTLSEITEEETRTMDVMTLDRKKTEPRESQVTAAEEPEPKPRGMIRSFGVMLAEQKHFWPWYLTLMFGAIIAGASAPVQAYLFAALLSCFYFPPIYLVPLTNFWCLMFVILACGVMVGYFALGFASTRIAFLITTHYQAEYFKNILSKPVSFFDGEGHSVGALTALVALDPQQLQQLLGTNMAFALISVLSVVGCLTLAFFFGWKLTAVALSCAMPLAVAAGFFRVRVEKSFQKMNLRVFSESAKFATESMGAIRTVTALTLEDSICKRYEVLLHDHVGKAFKKARLATIVFAASDAIPLLCMAFILWYGGGLLVSGEYWSFQYLVVYISVIQGAMGAGQWLSFAPNIAQATVAANRIQDMRIKEVDEDHGMRLTRDTSIVNDKEIKGVKIELRDVWFRYPTRDIPVLCGVDMTIEKGQFAAIVGPSGCGKTSIISLLERFYNVKSGGILYNGVNIEDIRIRDYRKTISLVAQEAFLFQGTIRENILFGVDPGSVSEDELHQACREAEIHDFVMSLPDGYNTKVGFRGVLLSGGQKQRLSIARALIRDPRLLLLDEATSALDSETEKLVQGVFEKTKKTRTMVVVAHRLATIQNADVIFVLGDGNVIEKGTHAQLLAMKGVYHSMCQAQALDR